MGFARPEVEEVVYIATTNELKVEPYVDTLPRNWIPPPKECHWSQRRTQRKYHVFRQKEIN